MSVNKLCVMLIACALCILPSAASIGQTCTTEVFNVPKPGGGCCEISVEWCWTVNGNSVSVLIGTLTVPQDCYLVISPGLFNYLRKKMLYRLSQRGQIAQAIPNCPERAVYIVTTSQSACYQRNVQVAPGADLVYSGCGTALCTKTCEMCLSTQETDDCNNNEPMLQYLGCQVSGGACVSNGSGYNDCNVNTCDSN